MNILFSLCFLPITAYYSAINLSDTENPSGTYGLYLDHSTYIELKLNEDKTYEYIDRFELGSTYKFNGTWRMENNKVILSTPDKDSLGSLHTKWILKENTLKGYAQSRNPSHKRYKVELTRK